MQETRYPIDARKFETILARRGLKKVNVGRVCGFSGTIFSKAYDRGYFTESMVANLDMFFNIKYKDYALDSKAQNTEQSNTNAIPAISDDCKKALYSTVYNAVFDALIDAFKS